MENGKDGKIKRAKVIKIEVKRVIDENPDLSYLETTPEYHYGENGSEWRNVSEEDMEKIIKQYDSIWNACMAYARQDKRRLDDFNKGIWNMIGIKAVATIHIPLYDKNNTVNDNTVNDNTVNDNTVNDNTVNDNTVNDNTVKIQTIDSGGLFGIESDSDDGYIEDIGREQIAELKNHLRILCVDDIDNCDIIDLI